MTPDRREVHFINDQLDKYDVKNLPVVKKL